MTTPGGLLEQAKTIKRGLMRWVLGKGRNAVSHDPRRNAYRALSRDEEGGALVEIALTVPVLLGVLTGIVTFGLAFSNQLTLTQAVGVAGQYLSESRDSNDPCADTFNALKNAAPGLTAANINMTITINGTVKTGTTCTSAQTLLKQAQGFPVSVYATYPCSLAIYGRSFANNCQLTAKVTEYLY
jgi:Flp pilus assembly protein TadG